MEGRGGGEGMAANYVCFNRRATTVLWLIGSVWFQFGCLAWDMTILAPGQVTQLVVMFESLLNFTDFKSMYIRT